MARLLPGEVDAINRPLTADSSPMTLCGCDTWGSWGGRLASRGGYWAALPSTKGESLKWGLPYGVEAKDVDLELSADGSLLVTGPGEPDHCHRRIALPLSGSSFQQEWTPGRVCALRGGLLGPTGVVPCDGGGRRYRVAPRHYASSPILSRIRVRT